MNTLMTFGMHHRWRRLSLKNIPHVSQALDLCTGTGDFAHELKKISDNVIGIDFSENMLEVARKQYPNITFKKEDALSLSFSDNFFDIITIGFGVRNFSDLTRGLTESFRVLKPNGKIIIIESGTPKNIFLKLVCSIASKLLVLSLGKYIAKDKCAYTYLLQSTEQFPCRDDFMKILESAEFSQCTYEPKFFGNIYIYKATKL